MPTYDYLCDNCNHQFEAFQSITAAPLTDCPECNVTGSVKRLISAGNGLIFKGSGFYITDYRKPNGAASNNKEKTSSETTTKSETKSSSESAKKE